MEQISALITDVFFAVSPLARGIIIFLFAYGEGLPVIGSILPGGTIALLVGSLSTQGFISPLFAISIITIGSFLGDITGFFIGKKLKNWKWIGRFIGNERNQKSWDVFDRHVALIIIFGKLLPVVRSAPSFFAGARNVSMKKYFFYTFVGSLLWAIVGIYGGNILSRVLGPYAIPLILLILIISGLIVVFTKKVSARRKKQ